MYTNGEVPKSAITHEYGVPLEVNVAHWFGKMRAACLKATGITLAITKPYGGYRDLDAQAYMHAHPQGPVPVAYPGYSSHGGGDYGFAVDIYNAWMVSAWLSRNAARFYFHKSFTSEAWHYGYTGPFNSFASTTTSPVKIPKDGNNMAPRVFNHKITVPSIDKKGKPTTKTVKEWVRFWETNIERTTNGDHCNLWKAEAGQLSPTKYLSKAAFDFLARGVAERRENNNLPA